MARFASLHVSQQCVIGALSLTLNTYGDSTEKLFTPVIQHVNSVQTLTLTLTLNLLLTLRSLMLASFVREA